MFQVYDNSIDLKIKKNQIVLDRNKKIKRLYFNFSSIYKTNKQYINSCLFLK
jgi:hypothetical protein